ncbi:MAG: hypothetical protein KC766_32560 [Myxococcales bacterium]|nr:hypothetical protein [Myxococcales bacterium]
MVSLLRRRPWLAPLGLTTGFVLAACASGGELDEGGITSDNGGSGGSESAGASSGGVGNGGSSTINGGNGGTGNGGNGGTSEGGNGGDVGNGGSAGVGNASSGGTAGEPGTGGVGGNGGSSGSSGSGGSSGSSGSGGSSGSSGSGGTGGSTSCDNSMAANTCATASDLGGHCADTNCGTLCPVAGAVNEGMATGTTSEWFVLEAQECSNCPADLIGEAKLTVPAGVNYDLFLWSSCNTLVASSTNGTGTDESVLGTITKESLAISDTQDYYLEVRYVGGSSCAAWSLSITGSNCQ